MQDWSEVQASNFLRETLPRVPTSRKKVCLTWLRRAVTDVREYLEEKSQWTADQVMMLSKLKSRSRTTGDRRQV